MNGDTGTTTGPVTRGEVAAKAVARLAAEFPERDAATVSDTVAWCRRDLGEVHPEALPELLERLARQRLGEHRLLTRGTDPVRRARPPAPNGPAVASGRGRSWWRVRE